MEPQNAKTPQVSPAAANIHTRVPMQFIVIDIAFVPIYDGGYRHFLLIVDIFSKFIEAVPLIEQTAPSVLDGLSKR